MKNLIPIVMFCFSFNSFSSGKCLAIEGLNRSLFGDQVVTKDINKVDKGVHSLIFHSDSCGIKGCLYYVVTKVNSMCNKITFNKRGVILPDSFKGNRFEFREKGEVKVYLYSHKRMKFRGMK